jgi:hypothetical protein
VEESGLYRMKCDRGHETVTCLQQMKFEVLMDLAAYAITDGYYREAVSSFAAALERFQEFYIRVQCDRQKIAAAGVEAAWKHVSAQSERQLGAFAFAYLGANGTPPPMLSPKDVKFRKDSEPRRGDPLWRKGARDNFAGPYATPCERGGVCSTCGAVLCA